MFSGLSAGRSLTFFGHRSQEVFGNPRRSEQTWTVLWACIALLAGLLCGRLLLRFGWFFLFLLILGLGIFIFLHWLFLLLLWRLTGFWCLGNRRCWCLT